MRTPSEKQKAHWLSLTGKKRDSRIGIKISQAKLGHRHSDATKEKIRLAVTGLPVSKDIRKKISLSNSGKVRSLESRSKISKARMGMTFSAEHRKKLSLALTGKKHSASTIQKRATSITGKKRSEATKQKLRMAQLGRKASLATRLKLSRALTGKKHSLATIVKRALAQSGDKSHFWRGGLAYFPYPTGWSKTFKKQIRDRDGYQCRECGVLEKILKRLLHVHHIDYVKTNLHPGNLICLCSTCHGKTQTNRNYWILYYQEKNKTYADTTHCLS